MQLSRGAVSTDGRDMRTQACKQVSQTPRCRARQILNAKLLQADQQETWSLRDRERWPLHDRVAPVMEAAYRQ